MISPLNWLKDLNRSILKANTRTEAKLDCRACTEAELCSSQFRHWLKRLKIPFAMHRKYWEYAFIAQALSERGMLEPGRRGLGFAVGNEPLVALFASLGCEVLATDLPPEHEDAQCWADSGQHMQNASLLNRSRICSKKKFEQRVQSRYVDMNVLPSELTGFDFIWSSCSIEHLGSIDHGKYFIEKMTRCLKPGGVAVHTTEWNVNSEHETIDTGMAVLFRKKDIEEMARIVAARGCRMLKRNYEFGCGSADRHIDKYPFSLPHLKLEFGSFVTTSYGIIIEKLPFC